MMLRTFFLLACALAALSTLGCGGGTSSTTDAAPRMDAAASDGGAADDAAILGDAGSIPDGGVDAGANDAAVTADAGTDAGARTDSGGGALDCSSLPACPASKGCGPTLVTACCCGDSVFDPATAIGCCCGYGIVPGNMLTCEG